MVLKEIFVIIGIVLCTQGPSVLCLKCLLCDQIVEVGQQTFTNFSKTLNECTPYACRFKEPTSTPNYMCSFELWISFGEGKVPTVSIKFQSLYKREYVEGDNVEVRVESSILNTEKPNTKYTIYYTCTDEVCNSFENVTSVLNNIMLDFNPRTVLGPLSIPTTQQQYPLSCLNYTNITTVDPKCEPCETYYPEISLKAEPACATCVSSSCEKNQFCGTCYDQRKPSFDDNRIVAHLDYKDKYSATTKSYESSTYITCNTPNCNSPEKQKQAMSSFVLRYNPRDAPTTASTTTTTMSTTTSDGTHDDTTIHNSGWPLYSKLLPCWIIAYRVAYFGIAG